MVYALTKPIIEMEGGVSLLRIHSIELGSLIKKSAPRLESIIGGREISELEVIYSISPLPLNAYNSNMIQQ